ncbi:MAG: endolytic transglycosylase MltG [Pleurocapsa sp.]
MNTKQPRKSRRPRRKKNKYPRYLPAIAAVSGITLILSGLWWKTQTSPVANAKSATDKEQVKFVVSSGMTGYQIGNKLQEEGLIKSYQAWKLWTLPRHKLDSQGGFKAGTYLLSPQESLSEIANKIWNGEIMQTTFTIPEGWSIAQMAEYFESLEYFSAEEFIAAAEEIPYDKYPWLPQNLPILEGFLYPDTYKITSDRINNPQAVIETMLDRFQELALPAYDPNQTNLDLLEWVTLSSIVEKEAVVGEERPLIAGVFAARLQKGMRLESDPTVEYGLGIRQTADMPLTYKQVGTPSPYNTYMNSGLPPTPIAAPGIASLKATLNPESTEYLFFVARYDGTHVFSKTLVEHEAATRQIRYERQQQN